MKNRIVGLGFLLLGCAVICCAQTQDTPKKDSTDAKPATAPTDKSAPKQDAPATPEKKKPKKVWTNDEMTTLPGQISVVGEANQGVESKRAPGHDSSSGAGDAQQMQIDSYRQQISDLHNQIDAADQRIAQLKNFKGENSGPTGGINMNQGYDMVPVEDQVKQLEAKKKKLEAQIEDVENEARKNGIDPGKESSNLLEEALRAVCAHTAPAFVKKCVVNCGLCFGAIWSCRHVRWSCQQLLLWLPD